jgi:hypothetical protein
MAKTKKQYKRTPSVFELESFGIKKVSIQYKGSPAGTSFECSEVFSKISFVYAYSSLEYFRIKKSWGLLNCKATFVAFELRTHFFSRVTTGTLKSH